MGILEKLRAPGWKHADPTVRLAALYELGADDGDALRTLAREDADARVRRAAVARLDDAALLAEAAGSDPDDTVRAEAVRGLAGLLVETNDAAGVAGLVRHLLALGRGKEVAAAARDHADADMRAAIVDGVVDDAKTLASIARHARDGATRMRALARVSEPAELQKVALKSDYTDAAVGALDRLDARDVLVDVAEHARSKVAARRARVRVQALDAPVPAPVPEAPAAMAPEHQARAEALAVQVDALVAVEYPATAGEALAAARLAWAEFHAEVVEVAPAAVARFEAACEAVREAIAHRAEELEAERARQSAAAREQADRLAICIEIERLAGEGADDRIAELKVAWDALPPMASEYAASLTRRFQDACRVFGERQRRQALAATAAARLATLAEELEHLQASVPPLEELVARWRGLRRDTEVLFEHAAANPEAAARLERAVAQIETREREHQERERARLDNNLKRLHQLCRHVEALAIAEDVTLKSGERALREIKQALETEVELPTRKDRQDARTRLEQARAVLGPRVQELRDVDEWQRWANLQVQEELCREMEALAEEPSLEVAARQMKALQGRWKPVALAPRAQGDAMWRRFKTAQDAVYARTSTWMTEQREARSANLERKVALCAQAEALADSTDWAKTATALQQLQAEWKALGAVPRGREKAVWERFRAACDRFFTRRQEDLKVRKDEWSANLAQKVALCERAEALAESSDWDAAAAELKGLQAQWKAVGPVRRSRSEAVWKRFRGACDRFFERYKHRHQADLQGRAQVRDAVIAELTALALARDAGADPPDGLYDTVRAARARWQEAPELPRTMGQDLAVRYHDALARLVAAWPAAFAGTDLDPDATRKRMEKLIERVEGLGANAPARAAAAPAPLSPTEQLAQALRERLAANTIGGGARPGPSDDDRRRAVEQEVRSAQAQWARLGPVPPDVAAPLHERFMRACQRAQGARRRAS
jgi:hypothetical protein